MTEAITSHQKEEQNLAETEAGKAPPLYISVRHLIGTLRIVPDQKARQEIQNELVNSSRPIILGFLNAHAFNLSWSDMNVRRSFASADVLLRDGVGMARLCRQLGLPDGLNMNGTDFIPELLIARSGLRVALFGSDSAAGMKAAQVLKQRGVDIVSTLDGFQHPERYISEARKQKPEIILLAMGMPIQEKLSVKLREALRHPCLIINGGAIIDFLAMRVSRAPSFVRSVGLEWTWRFLNEPVRLFSRYIIGNPLFLLRAHKLAQAQCDLGCADMSRAAVVRGIVIASPGGEEGRGGMGIVTKLMVQQLRLHHADCVVTAIDPRGHGSIIQTPYRTVKALFQLRAAAKRGANILHLQVSERSSFIRKGLLALMARRLGMTVILHHHGAELIPFYQKTTKIMQAYVRSIVALADVNIVLGDLWKRFMIDNMCALPHKVIVLRNGVPDLATSVAHYPSPRGRLRILSLAQLCERKGSGDIIRALSDLKNRKLDVEVVLAGGGETDKYKALSDQHCVSDRIVFTGWIDRVEVEHQLRMADIFVLPSDNEGLPIAIIEALSLKLPVIATSVGAIPEVLEDGRDCKLIRPHDPKALADAIADLASNKQLMRRLGEAGRRTYESTLTIDIFTKRLWTIYENAIKNKQS